ncbi:MAG TPA: MerR family transcriptional regulator [Deltaproteobacteria bacterium]|nr:MerR family transcriptional regulator [Deltaproteobacteria bacterium]
MEKKQTPQIEIPDKLYFKIGEVSGIAGVQPSVLRFWETEFKRINPKRTPSGQRLYRRNDIDTILRIKELLYDKKFTIQGAKRHLRINEKKDKEQINGLDDIRSELKNIRDLLT